MVSNRVAGTHFRNAVVLHLMEQGVDGARSAYPENRRLSELLDRPNPFTDISGVEPWVIDVRATATLDLSASLNDAERSAYVAGSEWFMTIQNRRSRPVSDAYCVLPLHVMARILAGEVPSKSAA